MILCGFNEYIKAFRRHYQLYTNSPERSDSQRMVLFYAAECILKACLIKRKKYFRKENLKEIKDKQHDIIAIIKELKVPAKYFPSNQFRLNDGEIIALKDIHIAWRYGKQLRSGENERSEAILKELIEYAQNNI